MLVNYWFLPTCLFVIGCTCKWDFGYRLYLPSNHIVFFVLLVYVRSHHQWPYIYGTKKTFWFLSSRTHHLAPFSLGVQKRVASSHSRICVLTEQHPDWQFLLFTPPPFMTTCEEVKSGNQLAKPHSMCDFRKLLCSWVRESVYLSINRFF